MIKPAAPKAARALTLAMAALSLLLVLIAAGTRLGALALGAQAERAGGVLVVRLLAPITDGAAAEVLAALEKDTAVRAAAAVTQERLAALTEAWGGGAAETLSTLRLFEAKAAPAQHGAIADRLEAALLRTGVTVEALPPPPGAQAIAAAARAQSAALLAAGLVSAMLALAGLGLLGAARALSHSHMIKLLADFGAPPAKALGIVSRDAALAGLVAGGIGAGLGLALIGAVALMDPATGAPQAFELLGPMDYLGIMSAPILTSLAARFGARAAAARAYARAATGL